MLAKVVAVCILVSVASRVADSSCHCEHGGVCTPTGTGDLACMCPMGFVGVNCEIRMSQQKRSTNCNTLACAHNEVCVMEEVYCKRAPCPGMAKCVDAHGDICQVKPCMNGGKCMLTAPSSFDKFTCTCPMGYVGKFCEYISK